MQTDQLKLRLKVISDPEVEHKPRKRTSKRKHCEIKDREIISEEEKASSNSGISESDASVVETRKIKSSRKRVPN